LLGIHQWLPQSILFISEYNKGLLHEDVHACQRGEVAAWEMSSQRGAKGTTWRILVITSSLGQTSADAATSGFSDCGISGVIS
jgi:hypothetical protein